MNKIKLGLIGILGEEYKADFWGTAEKVASLGYLGIECPEALLEGDVKANLSRFGDLGLKVLGIGSGLDDLQGDNLAKLVEKAVTIQAPKVSMWWSTCLTKDQVLRESEIYNKAGEALAKHGIKFCYHNHWQEFQNSFDGVYALDWIAANTDPDLVSFELDICWIKAGGEDPKRVLTRYANRIPAIHVKDYVEVEGKPEFTAIGTGLVNVSDCVRSAIDLGIEWAIVEQDKLRHLSGWETAAFSAHYFKESELV